MRKKSLNEIFRYRSFIGRCFAMIVLFTLVASKSMMAQMDRKISIDVRNELVRPVLEQLQRDADVTFVYDEEVISKDLRVTLKFTNVSLSQVLNELCKQISLRYEVKKNLILLLALESKREAKTGEYIRVVGLVANEDDNPIPGATVVLKGSTLGTATNLDGRYTLVLPKTSNIVLTFSFIGMETKEVKYTGQDTINVKLKEDVKQMDEVVVTGYQTIKKRSMAGSVSSVKAEDLLLNGGQTLEQALQGKIPGMMVMNRSGLTGTRQRVRVRGTSTLLGNAEPVWVVDGIIQEDPLPFSSNDFNNLNQDNMDMIRNFVGGAISWLNPNDIENITVLKDASATVMYGVKAANGVILIKTKQGQAGRMSVNYSGDISITPRLTYEKMNLMNSKERVDVSREIYERGLTSDNRPLESIGYEGALGRYLAKEISYDEFNDEVKKLESTNTDWFKLLFRNSVSMNHSLSISGGTDKISYYGSVNATINRGTSIGNESTSYSAAIGINAKFGEKVNLGLRINGSTSETDGYYQVDPYNYASTTSRVIPCFENGEKFFYKDKSGYLYNILHEISMTGNTNTNRSMGVSASFRWDILTGLQFESTFGLNTSNIVGESYADEQSHYITEIRKYEFGTQRPADNLYQRSPLPHGGELNTTEDRNFNYTWRNTLSYNYVLAEKHRFSLMVGQECRSNKYDGVASTIYGYFPGRGKSVSLPPTIIKDQNGEDRRNDLLDKYTTVVTDRKSNYIGYFASFTYGFDERYILTASFRSDASNRFGQDTRNRFLPVWSIGGRWNVHYEPWMQNQQVISDLNFRVSYGWQGNVAENYGPDLIARIGSGTETIDQNRTGEYMMFIKSLPYGNLRWEKTKTINLGTDFGLFQNKITWTIEYYNKKTEDMIVEKEVPYAYGVTSMPINGGSMTNQGIEVSVGFTPVRTNNFTWSMSINSSKNFNEVKSTVNENENWRAAASGSLNKAGYAVSSFWAFDFSGLNPKTGSAEFNIPSVEENPAGQTDATTFMKYMGTLEPDFTGGVSMSFRYKSLSLSSSFNLQIGGKKFLYEVFDESIVTSTPSAYVNLPKELTKRWRKPGDEAFTDIPALSSTEASYYKLPNGASEYAPRLYNYSDVRVVNASFLRCNALSLNYTLPEKWVKKMYLKNLSFSASVSNPFIIVSKEFKGMDPEVATGSQPISRTYSFGINVSL